MPSPAICVTLCSPSIIAGQNLGAKLLTTIFEHDIGEGPTDVGADANTLIVVTHGLSRNQS
jgi:hypothetical protein